MAFGSYFNPPPQRPPDYDDYFPPADQGDIIGNTGPGYGFDDLGGPPPQNPVFRAPITWGDMPEPEPQPGGVTPGMRVWGNPYRAYPSTAAPGGGGPSIWSRIGRKILDVLRPGQQGQGQGRGNTLPAIARILEGLSKGRAQGRITEAEMARLYDYLNLARTRTFYDRAGAELDQRKFAQDLQERSFGNATRAAFLQNYTAPPGSAPPEMARFVGPRAPGLESIPQASRDAYAGAMYRNAITELLDPLQPGTATSGRRMAALPEPEPISPTPEAGRFDDALNWASIIMGGLYPPQTTPPQQTQTETPKPQTQTPPEAIPPRRSADTFSPARQPNYVGDAVQTPGINTLSMPGPSSPLSSTAPSTMNAGLTGGLPENRLPPIADLVPDVPRPTAPLSPYDPYGDPYGRLRGRRTV